MKNKKILFIGLFAILFVLFSCSSVFASTSLTDSDGTTYILPDLPEEINGCPYIISRCEKYNTYCLLFVKSDDFSQFVNSDGDVILPVDASGNQCSDVYLAETKTLDNPTSWTTKKWGGLQPATSHHFIYANYNIYNTDGTVFFQPAPQGIVARQVEKVEMSQVMKELVGLVPLVIGLLVLAIGLRKALVTFWRVLRAS